MTSKESLKEICLECERCMGKLQIACPFRSISNEYCDKYEQIKKELEILEIIKKHYDKNSLFVTMGTALSFWIDKSDHDFDKVKEWLKDDIDEDLTKKKEKNNGKQQNVH